MIQSEIDTIKDIVDLSKVENINTILTILNNKGYDLKLIDNTEYLRDKKKLEVLKIKYPLVEEFKNNDWIIYFQSQSDGYINYTNTKKDVIKLIQRSIEENSEFDVYEIYYKYKPVDFKIKIRIDIKKDDMEIISQKEYDNISSLYINFNEFINNRKSLRYNELERLIKQFDELFSLECTDSEYYILYDDSWKVKGSTLMLIAQAFNIYIETKLNKYKEKK